MAERLRKQCRASLGTRTRECNLAADALIETDELFNLGTEQRTKAVAALNNQASDERRSKKVKASAFKETNLKPLREAVLGRYAVARRSGAGSSSSSSSSSYSLAQSIPDNWDTRHLCAGCDQPLSARCRLSRAGEPAHSCTCQPCYACCVSVCCSTELDNTGFVPRDVQAIAK